VLRYLPTNLSRPQIASELSVSVNTVSTHIRSIYAKLQVSDRSRPCSEPGTAAASRRPLEHEVAQNISWYGSDWGYGLMISSLTGKPPPTQARPIRCRLVVMWCAVAFAPGGT